MSDSNLDKWLGNSVQPQKQQPKEPEDDGNRDEIIEFMLNWIHILAMRGHVKEGSMRSLHEEFKEHAENNSMELSHLQWLESALKKDDQYEE